MIDVPEDNMPVMPDNADIEENLLPSISVNNESNITPFYANVDEDVYISVRIINPNSYVILRFTLNGVVYQSYQFEDGSTSELLVLKVNSGLTPGIKEFTIDQIKYISDEDNVTRDVIIDGNQTVKLSVAYDKEPSASIDNEIQDFTSYTGSVNISDPYSLVNFENGDCKLYFYDGNNILKEEVLQKGVNTFTVNGLQQGNTYQYMIVANYDKLDERGFSTHVLAKREVNTGMFIKLTNVSSSQESISFDYRTLNQMANVIGAYLFKDGEAVKSLDCANNEKEFTNLLSNTQYELRLYYGFTLDGTDYVYYDSFPIKTKAHAVPTLSATFTVYESSVEYHVHLDDEENLIKLKGIKLYTQNGEFIANGSYDANTITNLNRNTNYLLRFVYSYDLNDGNGEVEAEKVIAFSTSKAIPVVEIRPFRSTASTVGFDLLVTDPNVVGRINSIRLYSESGMFISQLNNTADREFSGLSANTKYIIQVGYTYDLDDGNGSQIAMFEAEVSTAKNMPSVDFIATSTVDSIALTINANDRHNAGTIKSIEVSDVNETIVPANLVTISNLLSNKEYTVKVTYEYDLLDFTGSHELVVTKTIKTAAKVVPVINLEQKEITYSSIEVLLKSYDPSKILNVKKTTLNLGTIKVEEIENSTSLKFENLYSNSRYVLSIDYEYDLNDGNGAVEKNAEFYVSTLKRDNITVEYKNMLSGVDFINFDLKITDKDNLATIKSIEIYKESELVESLTDLSVRRFENLENETFYSIVTTYEFDLNDGKGVQTDSATILYGTSGSKIYVNSIDVLNNENPKVGDEVQVRVELDNTHALEVTAIYISGVRCEVQNNNQVSQSVIIKFVPETEGGLYQVKVTGYEYITSGIVLQEELTSEYEEDILIMGEMEVLDYFAISDTYYENYNTTPLRILEINNPTGYEIYKIGFGDNNETTNFKMIDANHILILENGGNYYGDKSDLRLTSITYGFEGVQRTLDVSGMSCQVGLYNDVVHISTIDELMDLVNNGNAKYYILDNDIDAKGVTWEGLSGSGVFDGNGHTISNLAIVINNESTTNNQHYGLFKSFNGIIFDLHLEDLYFSITTQGSVYVAGISSDYARVYDSSVSGTIEVNAPSGRVAGVSVSTNNNYGISTNNYVNDMVIRVSGGVEAALVTDNNNYYYYSWNNGSYYEINYYYDFAKMQSMAFGNSYVLRDNVKSYRIYFNDGAESAALYVNKELENYTYHLHTNCYLEDRDLVGMVINSIDIQRDGYFVEWYDNEELSGDPISFPYTSKDNCDLYAKWDRYAIAPEEYTYELTSMWDSENNKSIQCYRITSFGEIDRTKKNVLIIGGYHNGLPVVGASYEATRALRLDEFGIETWDSSNCKNIIVYYTNTVNFRYWGFDEILAEETYFEGKAENAYFNTRYFDGQESRVFVNKEYEAYYSALFFRYDSYRKVETFTTLESPFSSVCNYIEEDPNNAVFNVNIADADNIFASVKYNKEALKYEIVVENGVKYMIYNNTRFAIMGNNVYAGVKTITSDNVFKYIIYENDEVVIDSLLNKNLQTIDLTALPYVVTEIANRVFEGSSVRTITLNEGLTKIGDYAFRNSQLQSIVIPSTVTEIGRYAFAECYNLRSVELGDDIVRIKEGTFQNTHSLSSINFPAKLKYIEKYAFQYSQIRDVVLPQGLLFIGQYAFFGGNVQSVFIPSTVKTIDVAFDYNNSSLIIYTPLVRQPSGWKFVWDYDSNVTIRMNVYYNIKEVKTNDDFSYLVTNDGNVILSKALKEKSFYDLTNFEDGNIIEIAKNCFMGSTKFVYLPDTIEIIPESAFNQSIVILSKAAMAGNSWADGVASRTRFSVEQVLSNDDFSYAIDVNNNAIILYVKENNMKETLDLHIEGYDVVEIGAYAFNGQNRIKKVIIPDTVEVIGDYAFSSCSYLEEANLPQNLTSIGKYAFAWCWNLRTVVIPNGVTSIKEYTFYGCNNLRTLVLGNSINSIGDSAFRECYGLNKIVLPDGLETIGDYAFAYDYIRFVEVPQSVTSVGERALYFNSRGIILHHNSELVPEHWNSNYYSNNTTVVYESDDKYTILSIDAEYDSEVNIVRQGKIEVAPEISLYNNDSIEGWYLDPEFTQEATFPFEPEDSITYLYAKIRRYVYARYYSSEGYTYEYTNGYAPLSVSEPPYTRNGYYVEWFLDAELTQPVEFPYVISESTTFYPKLTAIEYLELDDFTYYIDRNGSIVLSAYSGDAEVVDLSVIEGLTIIGPNAFKNNKTMKKVIIPEGVTTIGAQAFSGCSSLENVVLPNTLVTINQSAFFNCRKLESIALPEALTYIGSQAFQYCYALQEVIIPSKITAIENNAFYSCNGIKKLVLPEGLTTIKSSAFAECYNLTSLSLPSTLRIIEDEAFRSTNIMVLEIPAGVEYVGRCALRINNGGVIIHHNDKKNPSAWNSSWYCYEYDSTNIKVIYEDGKNHTLLVIDANYDNNQKTDFTGEVSATQLSNISLYNNSLIEGWYLDPEFTEKAELPYTSNEHLSFLYAKIKRYISSEYIDRSCLYSWQGGYAPLTVSEPNISRDGYFAEWYLDEECTIPVEFPYVTNVNVTFFPKWVEIEYIEDGNFTYYLDKAGNVILYKYDGEDEVVDLSAIEGLTIIGKEAFKGNKDLVKVIIPEGVTAINASAFYNCTKLEEVELPSTLISIGDSAFYRCSKLSAIGLPESLTTIGTYAFYNCGSLTEITIPSKVTSIVNATFYNCYNLEKVVLPEGLTTIGWEAFAECYNIREITLPDSLLRIESYAFRGDSGIKVLEIPANVEYVGDCALRINNNGIIIHHNSKKNPSAWASYWYCYESDDTNIKVIYEDGKNYTFLVIDANYNTDQTTMFTGEIAVAPSITIYDDQLVGWYLDPDFNTEAEFPYISNAHISYIYAKVLKRINFTHTTPDGTFNYHCVNGNCFAYGSYVITEYPNYNPDGYYVSWYLDQDLTIPFELPYEATTSLSIYVKLEAYEYKTVNNLTYYTDKNGNNILTSYSGSDEIVDLSVIENLVEISSNVFYYNSKIQKVIIPEGVKKIGSLAFFNCNKLTEVVLPQSLEFIGGSAFVNSAIKEIVIPNKVATIKESTFRDCYNLSKVTLPEGLTELEYRAFEGCYQLTDIKLPETLVRVGDNAFASTGIYSIKVPVSVEYVDENAFRGIGIIFLDPQANTDEWHGNYYGQLNGCESVVLLNNGTNYIILVTSETRTGRYVYENVLTDRPAIDGVNISGWYLEPTFETEVTFPFAATAEITMLYGRIRRSVSVWYHTDNGTTWYGNGYTPYVVDEPEASKTGYYIEGWYTDALYTNKITFPYVTDNDVTLYPKYVQIVESESTDHTYYYYEIADGIVLSEYCGTDTEVDLSGIENLVGIGDRAFQGGAYTSIVLPEGLRFIGKYAFYNCNSLAAINLPSSLETIGASAFQNCYQLGQITLPESLLSIGREAFANCNSLQEVVIPSQIKVLSNGLFRDCNNLRKVTLPEGLTTIGSSVFNSCRSLNIVTLPSTLVTIGDSAFSYCYDLKEITIPSKVTTIRSYAFNWAGIRILEIPDSVTSVEYCALRISSNGVIIHNNSSAIPSGWDSNCFGDGSEQPTIIYNSARRYVVLVANNSNVKAAWLNNVSADVLLGTGLTWYTEDDTQLELVSGEYIYAADSQHITYLYGRAE